MAGSGPGADAEWRAVLAAAAPAIRMPRWWWAAFRFVRACVYVATCCCCCCTGTGEREAEGAWSCVAWGAYIIWLETNDVLTWAWGKLRNVLLCGARPGASLSEQRARRASTASFRASQALEKKQPEVAAELASWGLYYSTRSPYSEELQGHFVHVFAAARARLGEVALAIRCLRAAIPRIADPGEAELAAVLLARLEGQPPPGGGGAGSGGGGGVGGGGGGGNGAGADGGAVVAPVDLGVSLLGERVAPSGVSNVSLTFT